MSATFDLLRYPLDREEPAKLAGLFFEKIGSRIERVAAMREPVALLAW